MRNYLFFTLIFLLSFVKLLIPLEELDNWKWGKKVPCECEYDKCGEKFEAKIGEVRRHLKNNQKMFCSKICSAKNIEKFIESQNVIIVTNSLNKNHIY